MLGSQIEVPEPIFGLGEIFVRPRFISHVGGDVVCGSLCVCHHACALLIIT